MVKTMVVYIGGGFFSFLVYIKAIECFSFFYHVEGWQTTPAEALTLHHLCGKELSTLATYHPVCST